MGIWINARLRNGNIVKVRQEIPFSSVFMDEDGKEYYVGDLSFSSPYPSDVPFGRISEVEKAKMDERDYWRKLRGDIALEIIRKRGGNDHYSQADNFGTIAEMTKRLFDLLFSQDVEFNEKISHDKE